MACLVETACEPCACSTRGNFEVEEATPSAMHDDDVDQNDYNDDQTASNDISPEIIQAIEKPFMSLQHSFESLQHSFESLQQAVQELTQALKERGVIG